MAPVAVLLSLLTNCVFCSNADWTYGYSSTERTSMLASGTPESQWCTRSPSPTRLRVQIVTCPADTGSNLCLIAANRTPCRRHPPTRLQSYPHGLLLPQQSTVKVPLSQPCFDHFLGPVLGAMMKQVCWHSPCHCFLMLALLRPSRRTRQNRSRQQSAASGC